MLASTATTAAWPQVARSRGSGVRVSTQITSSVSAPRAHRANATQGGATPASSAILISAKLEPQTAERSTKPGSQARDERACERVIGTALLRDAPTGQGRGADGRRRDSRGGVRPGPAPHPACSGDPPGRRWLRPRLRPPAVRVAVRPRRRQQLLGVRAAGVRVVQPGEHPGQLDRPAPPRPACGRGCGPGRRPPGPCRRPGAGRRTRRPAAGASRRPPGAGAASRASRRPISTAARPPTPASTSSNTIVGTGSAPASTTSSASITRDSSPPDAPLCSGCGVAPGCATSRSSTSSTPSAPAASDAPPTRQASGAPGPAGRAASRRPAAGRRASPARPARRWCRRPAAPAAAVRAAVTAAAWPASSTASASRRAASAASASSEVSSAPSRFAGLLRPGEHAVDVGGVLAGERLQLGLPGEHLREPLGVGVQPVQVAGELRPRRRRAAPARRRARASSAASSASPDAGEPVARLADQRDRAPARPASSIASPPASAALRGRRRPRAGRRRRPAGAPASSAPRPRRAAGRRRRSR